ncbi:MAG TPA: sulfatase [Actinomycetes bacterium]|nr:sulfatase [Actinomycetes bacterium]
MKRRPAVGSALCLTLGTLGLSLFSASGASGATSGALSATDALESTGPNVVVILADDMPTGVLDAMPTVSAEIGGKGITFENGVIPTSVCCPSRASLLTGNYAHTTGVYTNQSDNYGAWPTFHAQGGEQSTLATHLNDAGYYTGLIGKYMNSWTTDHPDGFIPPGWDVWATVAPMTPDVDSAYYDYKFYGDFVDPDKYFGFAPEDYSTRVLGRVTTRFIRGAPPDMPLYLHFAPKAVHLPAEIEPKYEGTWPLEPGSNIPALNERDVSDKPEWVQTHRRRAFQQREALTAVHEMARSLDDAVARILRALADTGRLDNTIVVFLSDNGYLFGTHRLVGKNVPYAASTDVPMMMRLPGTTEPSISSRLTPQIDLTRTIADLTGVGTDWAMDGRNIFDDGRTGTVLEQVAIGDGRQPAYCGYRTARYLYVQYDIGEGAEFYDYAKDPEELSNKIDRERYASQIAELRQKSLDACTPTPPGFEWS